MLRRKFGAGQRHGCPPDGFCWMWCYLAATGRMVVQPGAKKFSPPSTEDFRQAMLMQDKAGLDKVPPSYDV
jgi:hypothetical protein